MTVAVSVNEYLCLHYANFLSSTNQLSLQNTRKGVNISLALLNSITSLFCFLFFFLGGGCSVLKILIFQVIAYPNYFIEYSYHITIYYNIHHGLSVNNIFTMVYQ